VTGRVYLVGAGPGDPDLITVRGAEVLRAADVVVYDRLASPLLLDLAPEDAERVYAGKEPGRAALPQDAINRLLVERARNGKAVVRLKGGDPFVFGRGGEEALACASAGVPFQVVPGVTSAVAAPALAGLPVTHRGLAPSFAGVTASTAHGDGVDLARLATAVDTLVVLMAAGRLEETCRDHPVGGDRGAKDGRRNPVRPARSGGGGLDGPPGHARGRGSRCARAQPVLGKSAETGDLGSGTRARGPVEPEARRGAGTPVTGLAALRDGDALGREHDHIARRGH
jgi:uroporphyrin-III C-methyltransferase